MVMGFSEFGRRVAENASEGTDHGTAGPLFLAGGKVRRGFLSPHSRLTDLEDGNLKYRTDFRAVYAGILKQWFGFEETAMVLGGDYQPIPIVEA